MDSKQRRGIVVIVGGTLLLFMAVLYLVTPSAGPGQVSLPTSSPTTTITTTTTTTPTPLAPPPPPPPPVVQPTPVVPAYDCLRNTSTTASPTMVPAVCEPGTFRKLQTVIEQKDCDEVPGTTHVYLWRTGFDRGIVYCLQKI